MKKITSKRPKFNLHPLVCGTCLLLAASLPAASAATYTYTGTSSGDFTDANNWTPTGAPGSATPDNTDTALFNAATPNTTLTLGTGVRYLQFFLFDASAAAYTFNGPGSFGLTSGGSIATTAAVQNTQTFNVALALQPGSYAFTNDSTTVAAALVFNGQVSASNQGTAGSALTLGGANTGANTVNGALVDGSANAVLSVVKAGAGTWTLGGNNTYSGTTTINAGTLRLTNAAGSVSANGGNVIVNTGGTLAVGGTAAITGGAGSTLNLSGGTVQVLGSDLTTGVNTNLAANVYSTVNTNGSTRP